MKIKFCWGASSNNSFKGSDIYECKKEEWETLGPEEKLDILIYLSGIYWDCEIIQE